MDEILELTLTASLSHGARKSNMDNLVRPPKKKRLHSASPSRRKRDVDGPFATSFEHVYQHEDEFRVKVNMAPQEFDVLMQLMENKLMKNSHRPCVTPKLRLFLTLKYLAHGESIRHLANEFKLGVTTVRELINDTCDILCVSLTPKYMRTQNPEQLKSISTAFYNKFELPHCIGAIGGKILKMCCPGGKSNETTMLLFGICDANHNFTYMEIIDAIALRNLNFGKDIVDKAVHAPAPDYLMDSQIKFPYFLVGNNSFPLRHNLMKSYAVRKSTAEIDLFNKQVETARQTIDNTFGVLISRWKVLQVTLNMLPSGVSLIVKASILLHNFLKANDESYCPAEYVDSFDELGNLIPGNWHQETNALVNVTQVASNSATKQALELRNTLRDYIALNKLV